MANSLYRTSSRIRLVLLVGGVIGLVFFAFETFVSLGNEDILAPNENRLYLDPENEFGLIERYSLAENSTIEYDTGATFQVESVFDTFPDVGYVYQVDEPREIFGVLDNALSTVSELGFESANYTSIGEKVEQWEKANGTQVITFDRILQRWNMTTEFFQNEFAIADKNISDELSDYLRSVPQLTNQLGFADFGVSPAVYDIRYVTLAVDGTPRETREPREAEYLIADVYRNIPLIDPKPGATLPSGADVDPVLVQVYTSDPRKGSIRYLISNRLQRYEEDVFEISYTSFNYGNKSPYLIVTPEEAWDLVQQGQGDLVLLQPQGSNYYGDYSTVNVTRFRADATRTELAFYEPEEWSGFVTPIFVFRGTAELDDGRLANFVFYVDAIKRFG